jgi:putative transposase
MIRFKGRQFMDPIILMSIRWYVAYSLSYRDIEELMLERGVKVDHSTINRWVVYYSPKLLDQFKLKKKKVEASWSMDETYIKIKGVWHYLYRAVDTEGQTIDFMLSKRRDKRSANKFFIKSIKSNEKPLKVNMDKSSANKAGLDAINTILAERIEIRQVKYLNNIIEQDHRFIKKVTNSMKGFKSFKSSIATLDGIELHHMLKKGQMKLSKDQTIFEQFYSLAA